MKKILKFERVDTGFSSYQKEWEEFEQNNASIALNILFVSHNSEEIKLAYKSNYNKRKNQVILLMINDDNNKSFCCKKFVRIKFFRVVKGKKETIISGDKDLENALYDALNYQTIEKDPQRISKLKPYINNYNWEGIEFPAGPK